MAFVGFILVIPLLIILMPFWVLSRMSKGIESALRKRILSWDDILKFEKNIGWRLRPNVAGYYLDRSESPRYIEIGNDGWPGTHTIDASDVIVFGDSFAYGYGIDLYDSFAFMNKHFRVKQIGAPGYNMVQSLLLMNEYSDRLRDKIVVWFVCLDNDLYDNINPYNTDFYTTPYVHRTNGDNSWKISTDHISPTKWYIPNKQGMSKRVFAKFCTDSPFSDYIYSSVEYLIQEAKDLCLKVNAQLVVFTIPRKEQLSSSGISSLKSSLSSQRDGFDPDFPDKRFNAICSKLSVKFIAGKQYLDELDYLHHDPHWTKRGNTKVAGILNKINMDLSNKKH